MAYDGSPNTSYSEQIQTLNQIVLKKQALKPLEKDTIFLQFPKPDEIEQQRGRTCMWYMPKNFTEVTAPTPTNEANVGSSMSYGNRVVTARVGVYDDWASITKQLEEFSPTNDLQDCAERLSYHAALMFDNMGRNMMDYFEPELRRTPLSTYVKVKDFSAGKTSLLQNQVRPHPKFGGTFPVVIAPILVFDLEFDPEIGSPNDLYKRTTDTKNTFLAEGLTTTGTKFMEHGGVTYFSSNNCKTYTSGGNTYYRSYMFGDECFGSVELSGKKLQMSEKGKNRFTVTTKRFAEPQLADPTNKIAGFASFRGIWGGNRLYHIDGVKRGMMWDHQASIA